MFLCSGDNNDNGGDVSGNNNDRDKIKQTRKIKKFNKKISNYQQKERDSNSQYKNLYNGLAIRRFSPLSHLSPQLKNRITLFMLYHINKKSKKWSLKKKRLLFILYFFSIWFRFIIIFYILLFFILFYHLKYYSSILPN